ncbi:MULTISPECIES: cytidine/deoxycytidylate deaminase family protein [unclassified Mycoplasma]|uniref:deaminase n=1 Tax=unclassified Mycoplasma TaxID=2683645 RepID=UPI000FDD9638
MILNWDQYFLALALVSGWRSKDPNTQVGAVLVNEHNRVIGLGYNGMPKGMDGAFPWQKDGENAHTKYPYVVHAEMNAILNSIKDTRNTRLFTSLFPCSNCAKFVAQAGIKEIVYLDDKYDGTEDNLIAKKIFRQTKVAFRAGPRLNLKIETDEICDNLVVKTNESETND